MPWDNSPAARRRSDATYKDPEYIRNRALAVRRANGRCEGCRMPRPRLQCDHITPVAATGVPDHSLANLQMLCEPCHRKKTATQNSGEARQMSDPAPLTRTAW